MLEDTLEFLTVLRTATEKGIVTWRVVDNDERDLFEASVDGQEITVERLMLREPDDVGGEHAFVRVVGLKVWEVFARGTQGYDIVMSMLGVNILGWKQGAEGYGKSLKMATSRIRNLLPED